MRSLTPNMLWICIDEIDTLNISGILYSSVQKEPVHFQDVNQMFLSIDKLFDAIGFPQSFQRKRSMQEEEIKPYARLQTTIYHSDQEIMSHRGKVNTYILLVNTRQHANWQGILMDTAFQPIQEFKDILELMHTLIQS